MCSDNVLNPSGIPSNVATKEIDNAHHQRVIRHDDVSFVSIKFNLLPNITYSKGFCIGDEIIISDFFRTSKDTASEILQYRLNFINIARVSCTLLVYSDEISSIHTKQNGTSLGTIGDNSMVNIQDIIYFDKLEDIKPNFGKVLIKKGDGIKLRGNSINNALRLRLISNADFIINNNTSSVVSSINLNLAWVKD